MAWSGSSNILVAVRCRPLSEKERSKREEEVVQVLENREIVIKDPGHQATNLMRQKRIRERRYAFDYCADASSTSDSVYRNTTSFLIEGVVNGFNATVFAYGATGSGKTHTMLGAPDRPGIMVLTLRDLYKQIAERSKASAGSAGGAAAGKSFKVTLSYVEVYNENIRDLLTATDEYLDLREDPLKGPCVAGVSEREVLNTSEVMSLLQEGNKRRTQEPTAANKESSRSHAVLQILVQCKDNATGTLRVGKLSLIDLAGSERAANTLNKGIRLLEGANINRSLLALGNCITALVQGKGTFVPYRDSKLTRLLKDSLGGNCKTCMISCISPAGASFEETCNTLKYANRAKNIKTNVSRNQAANASSSAYHINEYEQLITGLRHEVAQLKEKLAHETTLTGTRMGALALGALGGTVNAAASMALAAAAVAGQGSGGLSPASVLRRASMTAGGHAAASGSGASGGSGSGSGSGGPMSPPPRRTGMERAVSPIRSPGSGGAGPSAASAASPRSPVMRLALGAGGSDSKGGEEDADGAPRSAADAALLLQEPGQYAVPEGYILINAAEAAAAAEKVRSLREALVTNFQERMQLRRSLIELQAQNVENDVEIGRRQVSIARWEHYQKQQEAEAGGARVGAGSGRGGAGAGPLSPVSSSPNKRAVDTAAAAVAARREIAELQSSIANNGKFKSDLMSRLASNEVEATALREELDVYCTSDERRELLALEYRVGLLELEKVELEMSRMLHERQMAAKTMEIRKLRLQMKARDRLIQQLSSVIESQGLAHLIDFEAVAAVDGELSVHHGPMGGAGGEEEDEEEGGAGDDSDEDDEDDDGAGGGGGAGGPADWMGAGGRASAAVARPFNGLFSSVPAPVSVLAPVATAPATSVVSQPGFRPTVAVTTAPQLQPQSQPVRRSLGFSRSEGKEDADSEDGTPTPSAAAAAAASEAAAKLAAAEGHSGGGGAGAGSFSSPHKASSWLERAAELVRGGLRRSGSNGPAHGRERERAASDAQAPSSNGSGAGGKLQHVSDVVAAVMPGPLPPAPTASSSASASSSHPHALPPSHPLYRVESSGSARSQVDDGQVSLSVMTSASAATADDDAGTSTSGPIKPKSVAVAAAAAAAAPVSRGRSEVASDASTAGSDSARGVRVSPVRTGGSSSSGSGSAGAAAPAAAPSMPPPRAPAGPAPPTRLVKPAALQQQQPVPQPQAPAAPAVAAEKKFDFISTAEISAALRGSDARSSGPGPAAAALSAPSAGVAAVRAGGRTERDRERRRASDKGRKSDVGAGGGGGGEAEGKRGEDAENDAATASASASAAASTAAAAVPAVAAPTAGVRSARGGYSAARAAIDLSHAYSVYGNALGTGNNSNSSGGGSAGSSGGGGGGGVVAPTGGAVRGKAAREAVPVAVENLTGDDALAQYVSGGVAGKGRGAAAAAALPAAAAPGGGRPPLRRGGGKLATAGTAAAGPAAANDDGGWTPITTAAVPAAVGRSGAAPARYSPVEGGGGGGGGGGGSRPGSGTEHASAIARYGALVAGGQGQ